MVATRAVNPGVVSSVPARPSFFPTFDKSDNDTLHSSYTNGLTVHVVKQPVALKLCCVENW